MSKTQIIKELTDLYILFEPLKLGNEDIENSPIEPLFSEKIENIHKYFGLTPSPEIGDVLDEFLSKEDLTPESLKEIINDLSAISVECLSKPVLSLSENRRDGCTRKKPLKPIIYKEVLDYIKANLILPLTDEEFHHIAIGFRLIWNYSMGQTVKEGLFFRSVDQYLTSIDFPMDREKATMVVGLILEYLREIGHWG